jgi:hypothetical protein
MRASEFIKEDAAAVGKIATKKERNDPRYKTSLTVDVQPDTMKKAIAAYFPTAPMDSRQQQVHENSNSPAAQDSTSPVNGDEDEELSLDEQFDIIEEMVEQLAQEHGVDPEVIWEDFESVDDVELYETAAWKRKEGKNKNGGLNAKGVASYRREHPGSKLQTAVTTKPSKLKPGSKSAKRRKSFCARMSGVKGPMKKPNGKPTRKALALRKWNC